MLWLEDSKGYGYEDEDIVRCITLMLTAFVDWRELGNVRCGALSH